MEDSGCGSCVDDDGVFEEYIPRFLHGCNIIIGTYLPFAVITLVITFIGYF